VPLPLRQVERRTGVITEGTLRWWHLHRELERDSNGRLSLAALVEFCQAHSRLPAAGRVIEWAAQNLPERGPSRVPGRESAGSGHAASSRLTSAVALGSRISALELLDALIVAAKQAEGVATGHREQLEHLRVAFVAIDDSLRDATAPASPAEM
jgi:hypothetical protein